MAKRKVGTAVPVVLRDSGGAGQTTEYTEYTEGEPKEREHSCPLIGRMRFLRLQECPRSYSQALTFKDGWGKPSLACAWSSGFGLLRQSEAVTEIGNFSVPIF